MLISINYVFLSNQDKSKFLELSLMTVFSRNSRPGENILALETEPRIVQQFT